ncbi:MAG: UvrB/UvrC motif-containing protein [Oscillospiraceae bacterium]|jgi:protein arginine kinase activator|nr:UvrB/UvrC motif-containing protein [Oscillospiraceae bacterium]
MLCEQCKQREATTHVRRVVNGEAEEFHLCAACAGEAGLHAPGIPEFGLHLSELFGGFLGNSFAQGASAAPPPTGQRCAFCGCSLQEIARSGQAGCAQCYQTFREQLQPSLKRIHGALQHTGKRPAAPSEAQRREERLRHLREKIAAAVAEERYEEAARLRDEIKGLEEGGAAQ